MPSIHEQKFAFTITEKKKTDWRPLTKGTWAIFIPDLGGELYWNAEELNVCWPVHPSILISDKVYTEKLPKLKEVLKFWGEYSFIVNFKQAFPVSWLFFKD